MLRSRRVRTHAFVGKIGGMRVSTAIRGVLAAALIATVAAACGTSVIRPDGTTTGTPGAAAPAARPVPPDPAVGAVFVGDGWLHSCSAAVLDSRAGDLILTAAHCLAGGIDETFVAGFSDDAADDDVWQVDAVYLDQRWIQDQDPRADFAIARVSRDAGGTVRSHAGRGLTLGRSPKPGAVVTVTGYEFGFGGGPVSCTGTTADEAGGFPSLPCGGLVAGLSGAPWIVGATITGIVGGLHGGGCDESVSYSPPFDDSVAKLMARAEAGGSSDDAPVVFDDDCD